MIRYNCSKLARNYVAFRAARIQFLLPQHPVSILVQVYFRKSIRQRFVLVEEKINLLTPKCQKSVQNPWFSTKFYSKF